jgi:DNA-binding NarL/FixJ family response regulator
MTIRILIADDHRIVAEGLRSLVEKQRDMEVVALAVNGREAVTRSVELKPDVVVMDNAMPVLSGTEAARIIRERCADTRVVMLSMHSNIVHVVRALQAGASGYILKRSVATDVLTAIRVVHAGRRYITKAMAEELLERAIGPVPEDPLVQLSWRERQVLQLIAEGRSSKEIGKTLSLSPKTVDTYRGRLMDKLHIDDLVGLVKFAIQQGLISIE